jgi:hypothetical protein
MSTDNVKEFPEMFEGNKILAHLDDEDMKMYNEHLVRKDACEALFLRLLRELQDIELDRVTLWKTLGEKYGLDLTKNMAIIADKSIIVEEDV